MKVNIGNYTNWIGPYQIAEFLLSPLLWFKPKRKSKIERALAEEEDPHDELCHAFGNWLSTNKDGSDSWLTKVCRWNHVHKHRTMKIRIDPWDTWGMDSTLGMIILPMLKQLKATKHGSPFVDIEDVPAHLRFSSHEEFSTQQVFDFYKTEEGLHPDLHDQWDWIMDEMIWTFEQITDEDNDSQFHTGEADYWNLPVDKEGNALGPAVPWLSKDKVKAPYYQMVEGPNHTAKYDREGHEKHQNRINNGLRLFGKYYQGLWD